MAEWEKYATGEADGEATEQPAKNPLADDVNPFIPQPERDERLDGKAALLDTMSRVDRMEAADTARLRVWSSKYGRGGINIDESPFVTPEAMVTPTVARKAYWGDKAWSGPRYTVGTETGVIGSLGTPTQMAGRAALSQSASSSAMDAASGGADFSQAVPYFNIGTGYDNPLGSKAQSDLYGILGSWGLHPEGRAKALQERRTDIEGSVNEWQAYRDKVMATANSLAAEGPRPDQDEERDRIEHNQFYWGEVARAERNIKKANEELAAVKNAELGGKGLDKTAMRAAVDAAINGGVQAFASAPLRWAGLAYGYAVHGPHRTGKPDLDNTLTRAGDQIMKAANEAFPNDPVRQFDFANKLGQGAGSMAAMLGQAGIGGLLRAGAAGQTALIAISGAMQQGVQGYDEATQAFAKVMAEQRREDGLTDIEAKKAWSFFLNSLAGTSEAVPFVKNWAKSAKTRHGYILGHAGEQALEEFLQEGGQQVSQNVIAGRLYDTTRPWNEDVGENMAIGGLLGGTVGGFGSAKHVVEIPAVYDGLRRQRDKAADDNDAARVAEIDSAIARFEHEYGFLNGRPVRVAKAKTGGASTTTDVTPVPSTEPKIEPPAPTPVPSAVPSPEPQVSPKHGLPPEIADHIARTNPDLARKYGIAVPLDTVPEAAPVERQTFTLGADDIAREAPARPAPSEGDLLAEMAPPPAEPAQPITRRVVTPDNAMEVETQEQIVELAALKRATGDMQPRDRSRDESQVQARDIAANLDPEQMRAERVSDTGAPIVSSDDTIISGNGRTMALEQVYRDPALAERAAAYRASLGAAAAGMTEPVRILRLPKAMPVEALRAFADKSNRPRIAMMSATERAMRDANAAGDDVMGLYQGGDVTAPHNQQFFRAFLNKATNTAERGALSKDGRLTKEGSDRISNAILAAAYGDPELLSRMLESTDDNIRSVTGAMRDAAGAFIRMKQAMAAGEASQAFDITPQVVETARRIADLRDRGIKPAEFLAQQDAFTAIDPVVEDLLRAFYNDNLSRMISRQKLTEVLVRYADEAAKHREGGLFEDTTRPADIIAIARDRTLAADGDLFGSEAVEPGGAVAPDGDTVGRRGTDWGSDAPVGGGATGAIAQADDPVAKAVAGLTAALDGGLSLKRGDEAKLATALGVDRAMLPQVLERASERGIVNKDAATGRFTRPVTAPRSFGSGQEAEARQAIDGVIADALESVRPMMAPGQVVVPYDLLSAMPKDVQQHAIGETHIDAQFNLGTMTVDVSRAAFQAMARMKNGLGLMRGRLAHEGGHGLIHIGRIAARLNAIMKAQRENRPVPSRSELEEIGERDNIVMSANDLFLLAERARKLAKEKGPNGEPALFWPEEQYHALYSPHVRTHQATSGRHGWSPFMYARRIDEEAAMHLIDAYVAGQRFGRKIDTPIQRFLNILRRIGNALRGLGFRTADDVLRAFTAGEHANNAVEAQNIIRASVAPHETTVPVERFDEAVPARPDQTPGDGILAAISRWTPDGMVQREAAHLMADVKSFEASQWKSGLTAEEIAASMHDRYGIDVAPEDLVSGRVWWKIDEMLGSQGSDYVVPTFTGGLADIMGDPLVDVEREQTATDVDAKPDRAQVAHGVQAERAPQIVAKLTGVESKRAVELWRRNVSVPRIAETLTNERGAYVRLSDVAAALDRAGVFGHEPREPHKGMAPREDSAKQENNETVDDDGPETKPLTGREAKFWTAERDNMLLDELRKAPRPTAADIAATLSDRLGTRIGAHAVYRRTSKLRADSVVIGAGEANKAGQPPRGFPWTPEALAMLTDPELAQLTAPDLAVLINQRFGGPTLTGTAVRVRRSRMAASSNVLAAISRSQDEMEDWARALEEENERWNRGLAESGAGVKGREQDMEGGQGAARGQPAADATADVGTAADDIRRGAAGAAGVAGRAGNGGRRFDIGRAGRFGLSADGRRTVNGEQQKFFFVYKDGAAVPSDGATDETALRIMRSTNNWLAHAHLIERDPGRWEVHSVKVRKGFRGQGMATALYDAIEKQLGITMQPSGMLTDDGYAFWKKRDADAVRFHRRVGDGWLSPRQMIVWKTAANGMAEEATSTDEIERMMRINAQLNDALRKLPPEAMDPDTFAKMFAISRALPPRERANQIEQQLWHQGMAADDIATRIEAETGIKTTGADVIARNRFHSGRQSWEQKLHAAGLLTFAGERAATADLNALARAKALAKDGASRERIWDETGWFRGVDGKWRWEIDDSKTAIGRPGPPWKAFDDYWYGESASGKLGDVLRDRSGLRSAYPSIDAEHTIITMGGNSGQRGYGRITADAEDATELRSILLHEKQHGIQDAEDFARGGSPREFTPDVLAAERARLMAVNDDGGWTSVGTATGDMPDIDVGRSLYRRLAGEVEARNVQHRMNMTPEERRANPPWTTEDVPQDQQIVRFGNGPQMMASLETASERGETAVPSDRDGRIDAGKAIDDGRPVFVDERIVVAHLAAARSHLSVVPEGIRVAAVMSVVPMLNPTKESDVIVTLRDVDGWSYAIESSAALIVGGRAIFDLRSGSIVLSRFGTTRDIDKSLRGEIYHEAGHALWRRDGFSGARVALLAHANSIGTLDADMGDYLRVLGSIPLDDMSVNGITIRETYEYLYRDSDEASRQDLMDQESVAYLIEMDANGVLPAELTEAVRPILDAFAAGAYTGRSEAASEREAAQMAAVDASIGRSMRDDLDKLGYYSGALRAARNLRQAKGAPEQMRAMLRKEGASEAELQATGLDKFLSGKSSVTRDEIISHLEGHRVGLNEARYQDVDKIRPTQQAAAPFLPEWQANIARMETLRDEIGLVRKGAEQEYALLEARQDALHNEMVRATSGDVSGGPRWSPYSLDPSNPTYRETVLHLPPPKVKASRIEIVEQNGKYYLKVDGEIDNQPYPSYEAAHEDAQAYQQQMTGTTNGVPDYFQSGHFPEPNIIGHMMTSMTRHEGRPVYTIDQIQSDWGQKLRDGGVRDEKKIAELKSAAEKRRSEYDDFMYDLERKYGAGTGSDQTRIAKLRNQAPDRAAIADEVLRDVRRLEAEYQTAVASAPGHPLVNTTDQWVNTTLRRAIRQAAEADADYIAIPHGDTVLSYNPGGEHGMRGFYGSRDSEGIVPKNLRKLLQKIDRESPSPQKITEIETPHGERAFNPEQRGSDFDREQTGFTLFPLSDKVKQSVMWEGQAMFAISDPMRGINAIIRDMAVDLGLTVKQGITTREAKAAKAKVRKDAKDAALKAGATRAEANKAADDAVAKWSGYYNPRTGVFRTPIFYNTMQSVNMLADLGGREIEKRLGADLADPIQRAAPGLPNGFQGWFRLFLTNGTAAVAQAPKFTNKEGKPDDLYNAFFDLLQDKDEVLLAKLLSTRDAIETYYKANPTDVAESMVVDSGKATSWDQFQKDRDRFGLRAALMARLSTVYTATVDDLNPVYLGVRELLRTYLANTGKKLDLASALNPYKIMRVEARHANAYASRDMEEGIRPYDGVDPRGPSLVKALMLALGVDRSAALETGAGSRYRKFSTYLVSRYAMVEWGRFRDGTKERAPTAMPPGASNANEAIAFFNSVARTYEQQHPEFSQAADMVYDFQRELLTLQRDAGLITPEKFDDLVQDREYVPFLRSFEEEGEDLGSGRVLSGGQRSIFKTKRGSSRDIIDAIASIGQKVFETRQMIAQNDAKRSLMQLAEAAGPGGGILIERLDATRLKAMGIDVVAALRQAAKENDVAEQDTADFVHMAQQLLGADATATIFSRQTLTPGNNVLFFWEQGRLQAMQFGGDGQMGARLAQAMYDTINTFGQQQHKMLMGMALLTAPAQMVRMGVTTHPEFAIANIIRDAWMAFVYDHRAVPLWTQTKGLIDVARGADYVKSYMRFGSMMGGEATSYADKLRHQRDTRALTERGYRFLDKPSLVNAVSHFAELFHARNWMDRASGAAVGAVAGGSMAGPAGLVAGGIIGGLAGGHLIAKVGEASETATRARVWKHGYDRAIKNGMGPVEAAQEAAFWAHDYTDYSRHGSRTETWRSIIPFFNANVQGNDTYVRRLMGKGDYGYNTGLAYPLYRLGLKDITKLSARERQELGMSAWTWFMTVFGIGSVSMILALLYRDDERVKGAPEQMKSTHWLIPIDGDNIRETVFLRIPKPFQTVWFAQAIERMVMEQSKDNPRWLENYLFDLWNTWKPPLMPTTPGIAFDMATGVDSGTGRAIVPKWKEVRLRRDQYDEYTSEFAKWLSRHADMAPSPFYTDYMIRKLGASWANTALRLNSPGLPWYNPTKPEVGPDEMFIARRFLWAAGKGSEASRVLREMAGGEEPVMGIWQRLSIPYSKLTASAADYKLHIDRVVPDVSGAVDSLQQMTQRERGYAILGGMKGHEDAKLRMLDPVNRAAKIGQEIVKLQKEIIDDQQHSGKIGKQIGIDKPKPLPLNPSEKLAARQILTQLNMMEAHNALVLTGEAGWDKRIMFDTSDLKAEFKTALPKLYKEYEQRMTKAGVLPWRGMQAAWPSVKAAIENDKAMDAVRKQRFDGLRAKLIGRHAQAAAMRDRLPSPYTPIGYGEAPPDVQVPSSSGGQTALEPVE